MRHNLDLDWKRLRSDRPPALLLGGLDLLRPLGFAAIPAIVASPNPREPAMVSRYCFGRLQLPPLENRAAVIEVLLDAGQRLHAALGRRIVLLYGNDDYLCLLNDFRERLSRYFLFLLNEPKTAGALLEKRRFESLAWARGLPVPRALAWDEGAPNALRWASGPVLVKPCVKFGWDDSNIQERLFGRHNKARIFEDGPSAYQHPLVRQFREQLAFQEFVPGGDNRLWSFHGFADEEGQILAWFVGHKLRTFPRLTGMSTFLELAHHTKLAQIGSEIAARLRLKGIFKIDFKQDPRDGQFRLLEINARFNLWHHPAARNGINLPQIAYEYLTQGIRPSAVRYRTQFRWLYLRLDWRAYLELLSRRELGPGGWLASLLKAPNVYHLFSWTDPLPWCYAGCDRVLTRVRRWWNHADTTVKKWLSTAS